MDVQELVYKVYPKDAIDGQHVQEDGERNPTRRGQSTSVINIKSTVDFMSIYATVQKQIYLSINELT